MEKTVVALKNITAFGLVIVAGLFAYWYFFSLPVKLLGDSETFMLYGFIVYSSLASAIGLFRSKAWGLYFFSCICSVLALEAVFILWENPASLFKGSSLDVFLFLLVLVLLIVLPSIFWAFKKKIFN